ncbi:nuclear transport factor 2 family protein [Qipengyuania qiaonensis]|uniref:Nuclear transport factor 2 family protein n=1 Tax=Qipengyuania qiaonensis TaxID=2867240 RepID=A0ABS7J671_9SPHN|nr:nuclear transport factor 2 family protein [Qipengyuania qiaonensis]MBX7482766.1 nuclear transport factor 2 family protein [Qipengyuania qiaonensis]
MAYPDVFPPLTNLLRNSIGDLLDPAESFADMCAKDVAFEAPYAPGGANQLVGRDTVAEYMPVVPEYFDIEELVETAQYRATNGETVILEFHAKNATGVKTGLSYDQRYINVIRVRNGKIAEYRDYWNPIVALTAAGGADALPDNVKGPAART